MHLLLPPLQFKKKKKKKKSGIYSTLLEKANERIMSKTI